MRFFVTGATGFIGTWLVKHLVEKNHEVFILSRNGKVPSELAGLPLKAVTGDVSSADALARAFENMNGVFHLAGFVGYKRWERELMMQVNVKGTENVIRACQLTSVGRLVHMSSVNAIGASFDKRPLDESATYNLSKFNLGYSESKRISEALVKEASSKLDTVILNPSTVYGPGDAKKGSRSMQIKVARGKFPFYTEGGVSIAEVQEVAKATLTAFHKGRRGERYILAGDNISIKQLFELIAESAGVKPPSIKLPNWTVGLLGQLGDALERIGAKGPVNSESAVLSKMYHWFDSTKAKKELDYQTVDARTCIDSSVRWMKENGLLDA